jgi:beta-glucosidase
MSIFSRLSCAAALSASFLGVVGGQQAGKTGSQPTLGHKTAAVLRADGLEFKDLNRNGKLDPYEDWRLLLRFPAT